MNILNILKNLKENTVEADVSTEELNLMVEETSIEERECVIVELQKLLHVLNELLSKLSQQSETSAVVNTVKDDSSLVQIKASNKEIERRISAFIERKRSEANERNNRHFCHALSTDPTEYSCARIDAIYVKEVGSSSHVKVNRVVNHYGPQTRPFLMTRAHSTTSDKAHPVADNTENATWQERESQHRADGVQSDVLAGIDERLANMEQHLKLSISDGSQKKSIFQRLKTLEERLLQLESISPEYFDFVPPEQKRKRTAENSRRTFYIQQEQTPEEIDLDVKIQQLKSQLLTQVKQEDPG